MESSAIPFTTVPGLCLSWKAMLVLPNIFHIAYYTTTNLNPVHKITVTQAHTHYRNPTSARRTVVRYSIKVN
jgi:hypothetical protein